MDIFVESLRKEYSDAGSSLCIIEDLNFVLGAGSSVALTGMSGVGKSTLLHILGGLERPTSGRVQYGESDLGSMSDNDLAAFRGANIGFVFQFHHLLPEFTAVENVAMPLLIANYSYAEACERALELLGRVGLENRADHRPGELSGGEQQRVAIARAIVNNPTVVLADEPTGNLDVRTAAEIWDLLSALHKEQGTSLLVATHSPDFAEKFETTIEMRAGGELCQR